MPNHTLEGDSTKADSTAIAETLPDLATQINQLHGFASEAANSAIGYAARCGALLVDAKKQVKHGEWQDWVKANTNISLTTATNYIRLSKSATVADMGVKEALKELSAPKSKPEPKPVVEGEVADDDKGKRRAAIIKAMPKDAGARTVNAAVSALEGVVDQLHADFNGTVNKQVDADLKVQRGNLQAAKDKAKTEFDRAVKMQVGVKAFMSKEDFLNIRSVLHKVTNQNPDDQKALDAFDAFNKLADVKNWDGLAQHRKDSARATKAAATRKKNAKTSTAPTTLPEEDKSVGSSKQATTPPENDLYGIKVDGVFYCGDDSIPTNDPLSKHWRIVAGERDHSDLSISRFPTKEAFETTKARAA